MAWSRPRPSWTRGRWRLLALLCPVALGCRGCPGEGEQQQVSSPTAATAPQAGPGQTTTSHSPEAAEGNAAPVRPSEANLILIVLDTLRLDHVSAFGGKIATPNMDALAQEGTVFENAYTHAPITGPAHASIFTSLLPRDHGVRNNGQRLTERLHTLAEHMRNAERHTAAFVSLQALAGKFGFAQGFSEYHDDFKHFWWKSASELNQELLPWLSHQHKRPLFLWAHYSDPHEPYAPPAWYQPVAMGLNQEELATFRADGRPVRQRLKLAPGSNRLRFKHLGTRRVRLHFWRFPVPIQARFEGGWSRPRSKRRKFELTPEAEASVVLRNPSGQVQQVTIKFRTEVVLNAAQQRLGYGLEVQHLDRELGRLFAELKRLGLWSKSLIVLTADHGEELGEIRGRFGHIHNLREALIHVPLVVMFKGHVQAGLRVRNPVQHVDLLPSIFKLLGLSRDEAWRGRSLFPVDTIGQRQIVSETYRPQSRFSRKALRIGQFKYAHNETTDKEGLYDLSVDPKGSNNLLRAGARPLKVAHQRTLSTLRHTLRHGLRGKRDLPEVKPTRADMSKEDMEALRALGYAL